MLIDSNSATCNVSSLPNGAELHFCTVSTDEVDSGAWQSAARYLFKPVILNPLLYREENTLIDELQQGVGHVFEVRVPGAYSPHHTFRDMYLSDPPCRYCRMDLLYEEDRPAPGGYRYCGSVVTIRSNKPLTLGELIDGALDSRDMWIEKEGTTRRLLEFLLDEHFYLAKETSEVGKGHRYKLMFHDHQCGIGFPFNEFKLRPLLLTNDEYLCLRPAGDSSH